MRTAKIGPDLTLLCHLQLLLVITCIKLILVYIFLFLESFQDLLPLEDWTAKLTKLEVLLKLTGKFVYMYNNVLLILSTVTTLTCSQSTILEFPCRRMVQVCHLKNLLCLGKNFYTNYCCFLVCVHMRYATETCMCRQL